MHLDHLRLRHSSGAPRPLRLRLRAVGVWVWIVAHRWPCYRRRRRGRRRSAGARLRHLEAEARGGCGRSHAIRVVHGGHLLHDRADVPLDVWHRGEGGAVRVRRVHVHVKPAARQKAEREEHEGEPEHQEYHGHVRVGHLPGVHDLEDDGEENEEAEHSAEALRQPLVELWRRHADAEQGVLARRVGEDQGHNRDEVHDWHGWPVDEREGEGLGDARIVLAERRRGRLPVVLQLGLGPRDVAEDVALEEHVDAEDLDDLGHDCVGEGDEEGLHHDAAVHPP
mmetsp:Transcript_16235/g.54601  ORF Transcript_16235/g.54601 Transcript_16235/m.54601 type:complete len:281 (+) Transcript_16235:459-1301(+)